MWGCHFLIPASNALWRKFVKLHQGRLKLVYKGTGEGRRRRNVVHLRLLRRLQSAWLGGYSFFPFSVLLSCNERCKMPCFQTLRFQRMRSRVGSGGREWEWECEETETFAFLFPWKSECEVRAFCLEGGGVHESSNNCFSSKKQKVAFVCLLYLPWDALCPGFAFILWKHRCLEILRVLWCAVCWVAATCHFHTLSSFNTDWPDHPVG